MRMRRSIGRKLWAGTIVFSALLCVGPARAALVSGQAIIPAPGSIVDDAPGATNFSQEAFDEAQGVILPGNLAVDGGFIAAGTIVNSHMIFLNTPVGTATTADFGVAWSFDGQILGVMSNGNGSLEVASSTLLGAAGTVYPNAAFNARGLESNNGTGVGGDGYSVVGAVITVGMQVTEPGDWIRVITRGKCDLGTVCDQHICKSVTYRTANKDCVIEVGEKVDYEATIEVTHFAHLTCDSSGDDIWTNVVVGDCFFSNLDVTNVHSQHGSFQQFTAGNGKTCIRWKPGDLGPGESATLHVDAETGLDRRGRQEYTTCGDHTFNNGALLRFTSTHNQSFRTGPLVASVECEVPCPCFDASTISKLVNECEGTQHFSHQPLVCGPEECAEFVDWLCVGDEPVPFCGGGSGLNWSVLSADLLCDAGVCQHACKGLDNINEGPCLQLSGLTAEEYEACRDLMLEAFGAE